MNNGLKEEKGAFKEPVLDLVIVGRTRHRPVQAIAYCYVYLKEHLLLNNLPLLGSLVLYSAVM
jgi:hypothetical protein